MSETARRLTYTDYLSFPDDGHRHEVIDGEEYMTPAPEVPHQRISRTLVRILDEHVSTHALGEILPAPIDVLLSDEDVVQPDIVFISTSRSGVVTRKNIRGAPDLVIEILSPSTTGIDRGPKLALYARANVLEYWIVAPEERTVEIREFGSPRRTRIYREGESFESAVLPGLRVEVGRIFPA